MYSKLLCLLSLTSVLASCSLKTNEEPPPVKPPNTKVGDFDSACLERILPTFSQFAEGKAATKDIRLAFDCIKSGVDLVHDQLNGQENKEQFNRNEFRSFFATIVMKKNPSVISDPLLYQIFQIKKLLAGGDDLVFTKIEMKRFMRMLDSISDLSIELLPAMQTLTRDWKPAGSVSENLEQFEKTNLIVQSVTRKFGSLIQANGSDYAISNLPLFLGELQKLYGKNWEFVAELEKVLPIVKEFKTSLSGGSSEVIAANEWTRMMLMVGRGYVQYLRYAYFIQDGTRFTSENPELAYIFRSIEDLFSMFGDFIQEKPEKVVTKAELLKVFKAVGKLFPTFNFSETLLTEAMRVKQLFFGGGSDNWTDVEFRNAQGKVAKFQVITKAIIARGDVLSFGWKFDPKDIEAARATLAATENEMNQVAQDLASLIEQDYDLKYLVTFTQELDKILKKKDGSPVSISPEVQRFLPVVISVKNILLGDEGDLVKKAQWNKLLPSIIPLAARVLQYQYFVKPQESWTNGAGLKEVELFFKSTVANINDIINTQPPTQTGYREISIGSLNRLVDSLAIAKLLPEKVRSITVKNLLGGPILKRFLVSPEDRLKKIPFSGLSLYQTNTLFSEVNSWIDGQKIIDAWYSKKQDALFSRVQILEALKALPDSNFKKELGIILSSPIDLTYDDKGRMLINAGNFNYSKKLLGQINLVRESVRLVNRGASDSLSNINGYLGITVEEFNRVFDEIKPFVFELGLLDPRDTTFANSRFRDANHFTTMGDGNNLMSFKEGFDLIQLIISGEKLSSFYMPDMLSQDGFKECNVDLNVPKHDRIVTFDCVLQVYKKYRNLMYGGVPKSLAYMNKMTEAQNADFIFNSILAGGADFDSQKRTKVVQTTQAPHAIQYIEMLMRRFDANGDGVFTNPEALAAYPVFAEIIRKLTKFKVEKENRAVFMWFLKYGKQPTGILQQLNFKFIWAKKPEKDWIVSADRVFLIKVLGLISGGTSSSNFNEDVSPQDLDVSSLTEEDKVWACDPKIFPQTPKEFCTK